MTGFSQSDSEQHIYHFQGNAKGFSSLQFELVCKLRSETLGLATRRRGASVVALLPRYYRPHAAAIIE
jgi:hypothetical protein